MPRTYEPDVRTILPSDTALTKQQIDMAIEAASAIVDEVATCCGRTFTDCKLKTIETYLAAHFAAATENTLSLTSESDPCHGGKVSYGFQFGEGIKGTPFGQMANTLTFGCLAEMDKPAPQLVTIGCI